MLNFKLCYEIPGTNHEYIAPQLLDVEQPVYDWDDTNNLLLRYHYDFMPKGIVTRFIVEMHRFIEQQKLVWKNGVVLNNGSARAEVIELYHKGEIHIRVSGNRCKDLLTVVSHEIDKINASYERLKEKCKKLIPCNCPACSSEQSPYFYPLEVLHKSLDKRNYQMQCQSSFEMVDVRGLISDISDLYGDAQTLLDHQPIRDINPVPPARRTESWTVQTESSELTTPNPSDRSTAKEIFISFKWRTDSEKVADQIDQAFQGKGITIRRDCKDVQYKDSIQDFMQALGRGKCVIAVIDDAYLKSENCMFELVEILTNGDFSDRIFPIVLPDAQIYKPAKRIKYIQHWEREIEELEEALQTVKPANLQGFRDEIDLYTRIRATIAELTNTLKNMNTLKAEDHIESGFAQLFEAIERKLSE